MVDRRRFPRYVFLASADAHARTVSEGLVESQDGDHFVVTTTETATKGEEFVMRFTSPSGEVTACAVRVTSSTPVTSEGVMRFRLTLSVVTVSQDWRADPIPTLGRSQ